jgi:hypothetical protein
MKCISVTKDGLKEPFCFIGVETSVCVMSCGRGSLQLIRFQLLERSVNISDESWLQQTWFLCN